MAKNWRFSCLFFHNRALKIDLRRICEQYWSSVCSKNRLKVQFSQLWKILIRFLFIDKCFKLFCSWLYQWKTEKSRNQKNLQWVCGAKVSRYNRCNLIAWWFLGAIFECLVSTLINIWRKLDFVEGYDRYVLPIRSPSVRRATIIVADNSWLLD